MATQASAYRAIPAPPAVAAATNTIRITSGSRPSRLAIPAHTPPSTRWEVSRRSGAAVTRAGLVAMAGP